jgi:hypothetical protein
MGITRTKNFVELDNFEQFYEKEFQDSGYVVKYYHYPTKKHGEFKNEKV